MTLTAGTTHGAGEVSLGPDLSDGLMLVSLTWNILQLRPGCPAYRPGSLRTHCSKRLLAHPGQLHGAAKLLSAATEPTSSGGHSGSTCSYSSCPQVAYRSSRPMELLFSKGTEDDTVSKKKTGFFSLYDFIMWESIKKKG